MERVRFCRHCGELLESQWVHCPWCGRESAHEPLSMSDIVDDSLNRTAQEHLKGNMGRLEDLTGRLDALELELDAFLAGRV